MFYKSYSNGNKGQPSCYFTVETISVQAVFAETLNFDCIFLIFFRVCIISACQVVGGCAAMQIVTGMHLFPHLSSGFCVWAVSLY